MQVTQEEYLQFANEVDNRGAKFSPRYQLHQKSSLEDTWLIVDAADIDDPIVIKGHVKAKKERLEIELSNFSFSETYFLYGMKSTLNNIHFMQEVEERVKKDD